MSRPFASSQDLEAKTETFEVLAEGVYALTAQGDPNIGAIEGDDFCVAFEARATPVAAQEWLSILGRHTQKPIKYLLLSHYHAVRTLGASAFQAENIVAHTLTKKLIEERGHEDWQSELGRMPRLFKEPDSIPGLTMPTETIDDFHKIVLGKHRTVELHYCGRGHTAGDMVVWLPEEKVLFAGDLVEAQAALYTGDGFHFDWSSSTLDRVASFPAEVLVGGRGSVVRGRDQVLRAIHQTRDFLLVMIEEVKAIFDQGGSFKEAFEKTHARLAPQYGHWPIFEHCLPFNVQRLWDELEGIDWPEVWTAERDREVWAKVHGP